jgi:FimV-like protein
MALDEKSAQLQTGVTALDEKSGQIQARVMALDEKSGHIATEVLGLNEQSAEIATNVEVLRESVSVTQANLSLAQQDLAQAEAALASSKQELQRVYETQLTYNQAQALQVQKWVAIGKQVAIVAGLAMLLLLLVWLFVTALKRTAHKSTPAKMAHKPATVGQGPRRNNKPVDAFEGPESNDAQNGVDQENGSSKEGLSFQVGSILKGETIPNNKNDEPLDYLSHEEDMTTKLFLASSYKDMGELSKARKILTEVGSKGNPEQQEQAQQMLASLDKA